MPGAGERHEDFYPKDSACATLTFYTTGMSYPFGPRDLRDVAQKQENSSA